MTSLLEEAFRKAAELPEDQQDTLAAALLDELNSEARWRKLLAKSPESLAALANEALAERRGGQTIALDESL